MQNSTDTTENKPSVKPMAVLKRFFAPTATIAEMTAMIAGFTRPLKDDPDYVWCVNEAATQLGVAVEW